MYYLNSQHLDTIGRNWKDLAKVIEKAIICLGNQEFAQPVKPYLRYKDKVNRIIAMPAFIGGDINFSGIKWIASFPKNFQKGLKRAHSVSILNEADSGVPVCTINTTLISGIRTAAVISIGTATLAAFIGAGGLGDPIVVGLSLDNVNLILQGAIPAALLAILTEILFGALERRLTRTNTAP